MIRQLVFIATTVIATAQPPTPRMGVPQLGYVFDESSKAIRLISGVPGAASLDSLIPTTLSLDSGFVHSRSRIALANTKEGSVALIQWNATPQEVTLATSLGHLKQVAFSLGGDRAAITDGASVEVWSGLTTDPVVNAAFTPEGGVTALAINQSGLVASGTGAGTVVLFSDQTQQIAAGGQWTNLAFLPNGVDLLATDRVAQNLTLIRNVQTDAAASVVLSLNQPAEALSVAADGITAALSSPGTLTFVNLNSGQTQAISCGCRTARFDRLEGNLVLYMTDSQSGSQWLLDADGAQPRVMSLFSVNGVSAQ